MYQEAFYGYLLGKMMGEDWRQRQAEKEKKREEERLRKERAKILQQQRQEEQERVARRTEEDWEKVRSYNLFRLTKSKSDIKNELDDLLDV